MLPSFDNGAIQCFNELLLNKSIGIINNDIISLANSNYVSNRMMENSKRELSQAQFQRELRQPGFDPATIMCHA